MKKNAFERIYDIVRQIPEGKVASYGQVAELAGNRRWARVVGYALHAIPENSDIPWQRVVMKDGQVCRAYEEIQVSLLREEGVECVDGQVDMRKFQWARRIF